MHYALVLYPEVEIERIQEIRRRFDPTFDVIRPHVTVLFPVPEAVGEAELVSHILPDDILQWARGERASFSRGSLAVDMREFRLGEDDT